MLSIPEIDQSFQIKFFPFENRLRVSTKSLKVRL